ncbi:unnamed protein product [Arabis nemorensis]|uniref:Uncharacterized protein n=1 Tax=Arabis nemorensis TaxID=586526 RepID=A0A565B588_9BRAS|nr:unnamed protein product [Arabis nemorensis]
MEKTMVENESEKQNLGKPMDKLKADASGILICVRKLKDLKKHNELVEANINKRSLELELKENNLQRLSSDLDERARRFEAEKAEAGDLKKLVEELRLKRNELTAKLDISTRIQREIELRSKHLVKVIAELRKVQERQREMEDVTARKTKDLGLVLVKIEESDKQLQGMSREVELKNKELQILSEKRENNLEVEKTEADLKVKSDGLKKDIEEKGKELDLIKSQVKSWERKLIQVRKLVDESTAELSSRKDQVDSLKNIRGEAELKKKQLGQTKTVLVKHNGEEEDNLGKVVTSSDTKSTSEPNHPPVIYTYHRKRELRKLEKIFKGASIFG